ncbi:Mob1/phocein [Massariosphaeria phaeospora]|uniref:Mob1/phocein n=1 Tax=Massariosphaeria phaeospora TaxID=100035 RepID=A0A7C8MG53_9PLEO|nr:Mob1/phocein [Massariosphaeria phaeospora]
MRRGSSSPRLPSPPPMAEDQLAQGPKSPGPVFSNLDNGVSRRIRPGTKAENMADGPPLVELSEIDSAFQLTEHLKALHAFLTHPVGSNSTVALDRESAQKLAQPPDNVDKTIWLYELCRFLTQKVNAVVIALFADSPPCSSLTCPEMRASEWQYLCAVHEPPKSCCAIDYCCHTLDWAANSLALPKIFPSRLSLGSDVDVQHQQIKHMTNIFRRVYRIFAHAWFQHREMFWKVEMRSGLYVLFKTVCDAYGLIPEDNYTIPPEAEGIEPTAETPMAPPLILQREPSDPGPQDSENSSIIEGVTEHTLSTAGTTKRHRHSPSVGATSVTTVMEESEEEEGLSTKEGSPTQISEDSEDYEFEEEDVAEALGVAEPKTNEDAAEVVTEAEAEADADADAEVDADADAVEVADNPLGADEAESQSASDDAQEVETTPA